MFITFNDIDGDRITINTEYLVYMNASNEGTYIGKLGYSTNTSTFEVSNETYQNIIEVLSSDSHVDISENTLNRKIFGNQIFEV